MEPHFEPMLIVNNIENIKQLSESFTEGDLEDIFQFLEEANE